MQQERRRYFRIQDTVVLQVASLDSTELQKKLKDFPLKRRQLSSHGRLNINLVEQMADLQAIAAQSPALGRCLKNLQQQVDRLSNAVFDEQAESRNEEKEVSLSAQGVAFFTEQHFQPVDVVEIILQLIPSGLQMLIYGRVVMVDENEDEPDQKKYRVSLDFEHIHDADREALIKHIHSKQLQYLGTQQNAAP